jgi:ligand-binding sensor domain-containing protein/putative methionine-R-sulfoxide reductase with GAF domain
MLLNLEVDIMQKSIINMRYRNRLLLVVVLLAHVFVAASQHVSFTKANASIGLSDNLVYEAARDTNGLIWIATSNGLNSFNGYEVQTWHHVTDTVLNRRDIRSVICDKQNQLWIKDASGKVCVLDQQRRASVLRFENATDSGDVRYLFPASGNDMFMLVSNRLLQQNKRTGKFYTVAHFPDSLVKDGFQQEAAIGNDQYLLPGNDKLICIDLRAGKISRFWHIKTIIGAVRLPDGNLLVTTGRNKELFKIDWQTGKPLANYGLLKDQYGKPVNGYLRTMAVQADGKVVMTSGYGGMYLFDPLTETLQNFAHDPLDSRSISGNNTYKVSVDNEGYVFITTRSSGLNYYNCKLTQAITKNFFRDISSNTIFDGYVGPIQQDKQGHIWLGTQGGLIEWDRKTNTSNFREYGMVNNESLAGKEEVRKICFDQFDRLWVGLNRYGVVVMDKAGKPLQYYGTRLEDSSHHLPGNFVLDMQEGPDKNIWVATSNGLVIIDARTLKVLPISNYPSLAPLGKINCLAIWVKSANEVWLASSRGAYQYLLREGKLNLYNQQKGLVSNSLLCITGDKEGNVYVGGRAGLERIRPDGTVQLLDSTNSKSGRACISMVQDEKGNLWIGSDNYILCYQPAVNTWRVLEESYGFNAQGYRLHSAFRSMDGTVYFGGNQGVSWFSPGDLLNTELPVSVLIDGMKAGASQYYFTKADHVDLSHNNNSISFRISPVAVYGNRVLQVQYQLEGYDTSWRPAEIGKLVAYPQLPAGNYTFKARFTINGQDWQPASNQISISLATVWWNQSWFQILLTAFLIIALYYFIKWLLARKAKQREEAETEKAVMYLTSSMHSHASVEDMLWDVCRNCISKLKFEDSVIYLVDTEKKVLRQMAAWGPKTTLENRIVNPIELPLGKGIVGAVAKSGKAEIIPDTAADNRYIVDDQRRASEICVPIIADGEVIGVIDSEHSKKHFFEQRHLNILNTIASLLGSKITSARAEDEKRKAEIALLENKQRTTEVEMQALRAQMNPHFMFNSLNSINNFILKNDADNASAYLTRFARLMRLILDNSRQDWITLENEIKALQLYIEMESLRFDNAFEHHIVIAHDVSPMSVLIPPLIIQPYVENAIWHGLMHRKEKGSRLGIFIEKKNDYLEVRIEDNGVGREAAQQLKSKFGMHKKSHGMQITHERLRMVNAVYAVDARTEVQDLVHDDGTVSGTCVILTMKYKKHESDHH